MTAPTDGRIRPCTGPCQRPTRYAGMRKDEAPDTVIRVRDGKCRACLEGNTEDLRGVVQTRSAGVSGTALCTGTCGRMTRTSKTPLTAAPGTVVRSGGGMCMTCKRNSDPEVRQAHQAAERQRHAKAAAPEADVAAASAALQQYLASRRAHRTRQQNTRQRSYA